MKTLPIPGYSRYIAGEDGKIYTIYGLGKNHNKLLSKPRPMKGQLDKDGYYLITLRTGKGKRDKKTHKVSRLVATAFYGKISTEDVVMHLNNVRSDDRVVNLEIGNTQDNVNQKTREQRQARGEKTKVNILSEIQVKEIKLLLSTGVLQKEVAAMYGVSKHVINKIANNHTWKWV